MDLSVPPPLPAGRKRCPVCQRVYDDPSLKFCQQDGTPLAAIQETGDSAAPAPVPSAMDFSFAPPSPPTPVGPVAAPPTYNAPTPPVYTPPVFPSAAPATPAPSGILGQRKVGIIPIVVIVGLLAYFVWPRQRTQPAENAPVQTPADGRTPSQQPEGGSSSPETGEGGTARTPAGGSDTPATQPQTTPGSSPAITQETAKAIATTLRQADMAEIEALHTLDTSGLSTWFTDNALQLELKNVETLRTNGQYAENRLLNQRIESAQIDAERGNAQVHLVETWGETLYESSTHRVLSTLPSKEVPQTVMLRREGGKWLIYDNKP